MPRHPDPAKIRQAMDMMECLLWFDDGEVRMGLWSPQASLDMTSCSACHGGWLALTFAGFGEIYWQTVGYAPEKYNQAVYRNTFESVGFDHGSDRMARHLGFGDDDELVEWAHKNPNLWGNRCGAFMFNAGMDGCIAFDRTSDFPVQVITDHWRDVALRIETTAS